jgi:hypothetical protein
MRTGSGTRERQRELSGWVGVTPARNPGHGEGKSGALRPGLAPVRGKRRLGPRHRHGARLNRSDAERARSSSGEHKLTTTGRD